MATATATATKGFTVGCLKCGETGVRLNLEDLDTFCCPSCDDEFTLDDVREHMAKWARVVQWIDAAPAEDE